MRDRNGGRCEKRIEGQQVKGMALKCGERELTAPRNSELREGRGGQKEQTHQGGTRARKRTIRVLFFTAASPDGDSDEIYIA